MTSNNNSVMNNAINDDIVSVITFGCKPMPATLMTNDVMANDNQPIANNIDNDQIAIDNTAVTMMTQPYDDVALLTVAYASIMMA